MLTAEGWKACSGLCQVHPCVPCTASFVVVPYTTPPEAFCLHSADSGSPGDCCTRRVVGPSLKQGHAAQVVNGRPFFDREMEQANLLNQLRETPDNMLLVLGPRSSGKTRLLRC